MAKPRENHRGTRPAPDGAEARQSNRWRATFLNHLAESSNVSESAAKAGIGIGRAYKVRREEPEFARQWLMALWEGYSHLEMEVVRRLRECSLTIAGTSHILRPSFENLVLAEAELGSLFALVERASQGMLTLAEMAALLWHCLPADNRPDRSLVGHAIATGIVLIDDSLVALDAAEVPALATTRIAAIGTGDPEAVIANLANAGLSRRPPAPVHARVQVTSSGEWQICWTRRARGQ
ncbi:MAG: hypothetical protein RIT17_1029, partial [Pseudomonadota bacterium]